MKIAPKKLLFVLVGISMLCNNQAMALPSVRTVLSKFCTTAYWTTIIGIPLGISVYAINKIQNERDVSPSLQAFIKKQLGHRYQKIAIKETHNPYVTRHAMVTNNALLINTHLTNRIDDLLKEKTLTSSEQLELDGFSAIIQHEGNHLYHNDYENKLILLVLAPIAIHAVVKGLAYITRCALIISQTNPTIWKSLAKLPAGAAILSSNLLLALAYSRHIEQRADDKIDDNPALLIGLKKFFEKFPATPVHPLLRAHPTHKQRIERLDERLVKLAQANNHEA